MFNNKSEKEILQKSLGNGKCPDCGSTEFLAGPRGGMCQNIECAKCGSRFNIGPGVADRIGHRDDGKEVKDALAELGLLTVDYETGEKIESRSDKICHDDLGVHVMCNGWVEIKHVSPKWNILRCRACGLRKYFPATIDINVYDRVTIWKHLITYFKAIS